MTTRARFNGTVRTAKQGDLDTMAAMAADLVRFHHDIDGDRFLLPDRVQEGYRWWFGKELENADAILLVAEIADVVVGYVYGRIEERDFNMLLSRHAALHDVFLGEGARGTGAAEAMLTRFLEIAKERGVPRTVLHTATSNHRAQALFRRLGFRSTMIEMTRES
jgi:ribosomal protein S18 acetylase RimI-like enzyme